MLVLLFARIAKKRRRKRVKGKIYKTTDGYLGDKAVNKKPRHVVVVEQRKKDGAVAVSKIYGADDKNDKHVIDDLLLKPKDHKALTKDSYVGTRVYFGVKRNNEYTPINTRDFDSTDDKLTKSEMKKVNKQKGGKAKKNRKTYRNTRRKWENGFKSKKK